MKCFATAMLVFAWAGTAFAGSPEAPEMEPTVEAEVEPVPTQDWTGFYAGLSVLRGSFTFGAENDTDGFGLHAGYLRDLGSFVVGGELAYATGDYSVYLNNDWNSTRLKLIGGLDAGRVLPYGFVGLSQYNVTGDSEFSDTVTIFGLGAKFALTPQVGVGLEYLVEDKDDFDNSGVPLDNSELALRIDYKF